MAGPGLYSSTESSSVKHFKDEEIIWVCFSPCRAHLCYSGELCCVLETAEPSQKETKSVSKIAPKVTWLSVEELSSKNNIVIVEAVETDFLGFPTTIHLSSTLPPYKNPNGFMEDMMHFKTTNINFGCK